MYVFLWCWIGCVNCVFKGCPFMCCIIKYRLPFGVFKIIVKHIFSCGLLCFFRKICLHMLIIKGWIAILEKSLKRTIAKSQWCLQSQPETWIPMAWWHDGALVASWRPGDVGATINGDLLEIYWISNTQGNKIMEIDVASFPVQNHQFLAILCRQSTEGVHPNSWRCKHPTRVDFRNSLH